MNKQCLNPLNAPAGGPPYSPVVKAGDFAYISGQGPMARDGSGVVHGTFEQETRLTLDNLITMVEGIGATLDQVVKTTVFLVDMNNFGEFNRIYAEYFTREHPARSCVQAARLPLDFKVEVEAIVYCP
ncbi:MAG: Enamine/imine deaminase [Candidatus Hydrogenedentes bacterium ADurb.Bin179]|nr:MAG: Enamine/imine deaminase [Candidatus Hydrogenedentes bacterium ADurb.Bin179]